MGIRYELCSYEVDEEHLDAESVARKVGLPPEQVYKTLVTRGDKTGIWFAVLSANDELCRKTMAKVSGNREVELVALREVQPLTGYIRGGVTALGAKKSFPVVVDELMELFDRISVSAGQRGMQILVAPSDYLRATRAIVAPIARSKNG